MHNYFLKLLVISLILNYSTQTVIELTDATLNQVLSQNEFVMLEFYTEGCPHCEEFAPIYEEFGKSVKSAGMNLLVTKIDGNKNELSSTEWGIQGFPTIKFVNLKNDIKLDYHGERSVESMMKFIDNKINRKILPVTDLTHFKTLEQEKKVFIVFCGKNSTYPQIFTEIDKVISQHDDLDLFYSDNAEVLTALDCSSQNIPDVVIVKKFDEGRTKYDYNGTVNSTHFQEWISVYTTPVILELTNENIQMSMQNRIPLVFLITAKDLAATEIETMIYNHAKLHRREIIFISAQAGTELSDRIIEYYQVKANEIPVILGLIPQSESTIGKYKFNQEINDNNFEQWLKDFIAQKLPKFFPSEPIPTEPIHEGVSVVVGHSFRDLVLNNSNDVLLELYAPWCGHCKQLAPKYARLVEKLKNNKNLLIAKMDGTGNEYEGLEIEGYPALFFFKGGNSTPEDKFNNKIIYNEARNVASLLEFLKKSTHHPIIDIINLPNEDQIEQQEKEEEALATQGDEGEDHDHNNEENEDNENNEEENEGGEANLQQKDEINDNVIENII